MQYMIYSKNALRLLNDCTPNPGMSSQNLLKDKNNNQNITPLQNNFLSEQIPLTIIFEPFEKS